MPERQEMEFIIRADGTVEERVLGVSGPNCETLTGDIESALGEVTHREHTGDYYKEQQSDNLPVQSGS
jgi:hypothetical protein